MQRHLPSRSVLTFAILVVLAVAALAPRAASAQATPSVNKGKTGTYSVDTDVTDYKYFVCVPSTYADDRPAGVHLFFHGQNSQSGASNFGRWSKYFLEPYNLIGINMQYNDGDNYKDMDNKLRVAMQAVAQVAVDYKVLPRGVVASFSGGGGPLGMYFSQYGQGRTRNPRWPFNHCSIYGSNFTPDVTGATPMSWFVCVGQTEWTQFNIGASQTARMAELLSASARGGSTDIYLRLEPGKGHSISEADVAASAVGFARSDLAYCQFIYTPDYSETELQLTVKSAQGLALDKASKAIDSLAARTNLKPAVKAKAESLKKQIDARIEAVLALCQTLAKDDPVLLAYYGPIFSTQLGTHARAKELRDLAATAKKDKAQLAVVAQWPGFVSAFPDMFTDQGKLKPAAVAPLTEITRVAPASSRLNTMATEFLKFQ